MSPWHLGPPEADDIRLVHDENRRLVAVAWGRENSKLIASAPALLAALEEMRSLYMGTFQRAPVFSNVRDGKGVDWELVIARADTAIAAARGK